MKKIESILNIRYQFLQIFIMVVTTLASCGHSESNIPFEEDHSTMEPMPRDTINQLLKQITQYGDTIAYNRISGEFMYFHKKTELIYYSLIMANKYNYGFAAAIVANSFLSINQESIDELDPKTKKLVLYYALRAFELGYEKYLNTEYRAIIDTLPKSSVYLNL